MQPSRRLCLCALLTLLAAFPLPRTARADKLTITTTPPGATVAIDGLVAGTTPYTTKYPGGYFRKPHTAFGSHLDHAVTVRISKDGYLVEKLTLTDGPFEWTSFNGRNRHRYFLLKSKEFDIKLVPIPAITSQPAETSDRVGPMRPPPAALIAARTGASRARGSEVAIASDPSGADIYVDGKFVGETPSTIQLATGLHHIEVKSPARQEWERDLDVLKDSHITLHPSLRPLP
jgi:PEGA domain